MKRNVNNSMLTPDVLLQNEMVYQDVIQLTIPDGPADGPDGIKVPTTG